MPWEWVSLVVWCCPLLWWLCQLGHLDGAAVLVGRQLHWHSSCAMHGSLAWRLSTWVLQKASSGIGSHASELFKLLHLIYFRRSSNFMQPFLMFRFLISTYIYVNVYICWFCFLGREYPRKMCITIAVQITGGTMSCHLLFALTERMTLTNSLTATPTLILAFSTILTTYKEGTWTTFAENC